MCYFFTNGHELEGLMQEKKWEELCEEFHKSELVEHKCCGGGKSASVVIFELCDAVANSGNKVLLNTIAYKAAELFAHVWDANTLQKLERVCKHGNKKAARVLEEYERYRELAIEEYKLHHREYDYEKVVDENVVIKIKYDRVSFFRTGVEHVIFFAED